MTYMIVCSCTPDICSPDCHYHCKGYWQAKTVHQAFVIKHVHQSSFDHDVEVRENGQVILNPEVKSEVK